MTRSFLTVREGATVTHVHCRDMAAMWVTHLVSAVVDPMNAGHVQGFISNAPGDKHKGSVSELLHDAALNHGPTASPGSTYAGRSCQPDRDEASDWKDTLTDPKDIKHGGKSHQPHRHEDSDLKDTLTDPKEINNPKGTASSPLSTTSLTSCFEHRMDTIKKTLIIQDATGATHLQQL